MSTLLEKIKSLKLCLMAHPDYEYGSEFEDRVSDLQEIENELLKYKWIEVFSDHEISEYSKNLEPIWIILEEDEHKIPILAQPDGDDNYHGEDDCIYHYCDISHFMKIERPKFKDC